MVEVQIGKEMIEVRGRDRNKDDIDRNNSRDKNRNR